MRRLDEGRYEGKGVRGRSPLKCIFKIGEYKNKFASEALSVARGHNRNRES